MPSAVLLSIIAFALVRVTPIPTVLGPDETDLFSSQGENPNIDFPSPIGYADVTEQQSFLSSTDPLQPSPNDMAAWNLNPDPGLGLQLDPSLDDPNLDTIATFNFFSPTSDSNTNTLELASNQPYVGPELSTGDWDDYIADPEAKCPIDDYRYAACCSELLSENRYIPDCISGEFFF